MNSTEIITNGAWQSVAQMTDYRAEWFSEMLVERATWSADAEEQFIGG